MEIGTYTFAQPSPDPATGEVIGVGERRQNLPEEMQLADRVGLDVFGVGKHHRPDFAVSSPAVGAVPRRPRARVPGLRDA